MKDDFFLPYQKKWILDKSKIKIMEKSRQIGMSWTAAYSLVREHSLLSCRLDSWVSSRDELQAKLFIADCKKFAQALDLAFEESGGGAVLKDSPGAKILAFENGTSINSLSSNPDAQAGKRGTRVLDEFALHPDPRALYSVAYPGITWGGRLEIISTHRGRENFFNKLVEEARRGGNPKKISLHRVTLQDALEQGFLKKLKASLGPESEVAQMDEAQYFDYIKNSCADEESFMQEYMCEPFDDNSSFLKYEFLQRCAYAENENWQKQRGGALYLGVDVGRCKDLTVFWLLEKLGDTLYTRGVNTMQDATFAEQEAVLFSYMQNPKLRRASIDKTGIGRQFAERAAERFGSSRAEGISFTQISKEALAYPLRAAFESGRIRIPNSPEIFADLRGVRRKTSVFGGVRFEASSGADGHSDRFWALALALCGASEGGEKVELIAKKPRELVW
ncbi:MAG: terminase family protein [Opitutales bacterium]|nr:terminase family protein [Opitutales bacterium]